jgi:hypothetical protein
MATVAEKEARRLKALPIEVGAPLVWCKEHRAFSSYLTEMVGRNGELAMRLAKEISKGLPYVGFLPTAIWDNLTLESWSRPSNESKHWFPTQEADEVVIQFEPGDTIWQCGDLDECGRWWPDKASASACYDSHQ